MVRILNPSAINEDGGNNKKHKIKKSSQLRPDSVAMKKVKASKSNPFETIWSRRKFDILGKKRKGEERRRGLTRSLAIQKGGKSSVIVDKQIGEQTEGHVDTQPERQLELNKNSNYSLSDVEEDELQVPGVSSFCDEDDFKDEVPESYTEKRSPILRSLSGRGSQSTLETGSMEGEENRQKTKKEVTEEIYSKGKFSKRTKTLLKDNEQSGKSSVIVDKRIGEQTESLAETQPERQLKNSKYNLSDGEEDELEIPGVSSFCYKDDFEDEVHDEDGVFTEIVGVEKKRSEPTERDGDMKRWRFT